MMNYQSIAISFRIQLGFHAGNNEGSGGTNVMEPRRITVGDKEHDGISGEIIRHHILENFAKLCQQNNVPLHNRCQGLVPDRGREPLINWILQNKNQLQTKKVQNRELPFLDPPHYPDRAHDLIQTCALCDVGGYLIALEASDNVYGTLKRDSCFEVGWLITEHPAVVDYTQHSAYDPDPGQHHLFVQNMRVGTYGGVLRLDLDRIGFNDWWWLDGNSQKYALAEKERKKRIKLLLNATRQWLLSPSFAKQTGWLPHMTGLLEGTLVLSKDGPAPFYSPISFHMEAAEDGQEPMPTIEPNPSYKNYVMGLKEKMPDKLEVYEFNDPSDFGEIINTVASKFDNVESG